MANLNILVQDGNNINVEVTPTPRQTIIVDRGVQGATGAAATIAVGTVTTGAAGSAATVTNAGTSSAAVFNFSIPQGEQGDGDVNGAASSTDNAIVRFDGTTGKQIQNSSIVIDDTANVSNVASLEFLTNTTPAIFKKDDNLTSWTYSNKSFSVTAQETAPTGLFFSPDGTRMYIIGSTGDDVTQYALSTAWDVTTSAFVRTSATVGDTAPSGLYFRADGLKMYTIGSTLDSVREFNLSIAWDVSTITFVQEFAVSAQDILPQDLWFKPDGLKMYVIGSTNDRVYEYNLSTAWNVSTATFLQFFSVAAQELTPVAVNFNADGTRMYVLGQTGLDINRYVLSTPWDISTAVFFNNFYIGFQESAPNGLFINTDADVAYVVGTTADAVFEYATKTDGIELISNAGLFVEGGLYTNKNLVVTSNTRLDGSLSVSGATTIAGAAALSSATIGTTTVTATLTASSAVNMSTTTGLITLGTAQTTGTFTVGGAAQTGAITVGQSTGAQTLNLATGATLSATTKTVNIGTAGVSGSTTNINIGSTVAGALGDIFLNQPTDIVVNSTIDALRITQIGTGNALLVEDEANPDATPTVITGDGNVVVGNTTSLTYSSGLQPRIQTNSTGLAGIGISRWNAGVASNPLVFLKSRGTTIGDFTSVISGDFTGSVNFYGADGTSGIISGQISGQVDGTPATNSMPGRLVFSTTANGAAIATERMRIDSAGNVIQTAPTTAPTLATNGTMVFNLTSNTNLRVSVRGTDGVTRTANLTLA